MSGHLHLVGESFTPNDRHSVIVSEQALAELEEATRVYSAAKQALAELFDAVEARRDPYAVIAAYRRLSSAGELGRLSAARLEKSLRGGTT